MLTPQTCEVTPQVKSHPFESKTQCGHHFHSNHSSMTILQESVRTPSQNASGNNKITGLGSKTPCRHRTHVIILVPMYPVKNKKIQRWPHLPIHHEWFAWKANRWRSEEPGAKSWRWSSHYGCEGPLTVAMYLALLGKWLSLKKGQQKIWDFDHGSMAWKINCCRPQRPKVYFHIIWLMYSCLWRETSIDSKLFSTGNFGKWLFPKSSCSYWNSKPIFIVWHLGSQNDSTVDIFKRPVHEWMTTPPIWIHGDNPKLLVSGQGMLWDWFLGDGNHTPHTKKVVGNPKQLMKFHFLTQFRVQAPQQWLLHLEKWLKPSDWPPSYRKKRLKIKSWWPFFKFFECLAFFHSPTHFPHFRSRNPKSVLLTLGSEDISTRMLGALVVARGALELVGSEDGGHGRFLLPGKSNTRYVVWHHIYIYTKILKISQNDQFEKGVKRQLNWLITIWVYFGYFD